MKQKPFLLIADDDPDDQFLIHDAMLEVCSQDMDVVFVWDGVELLKKLEELDTDASSKPRMIMMDLNMPRKDGRATIKEMKADPRFTNIPVAVLTNSNDPTDVQFCRNHGVVACFGKPNTSAELKIIIKCLCDYFSSRTADCIEEEGQESQD